MATPVFHEGQTIQLAGAFTDSDGVPVDPSTVVVTVKDPAGATTTPNVTRDATGIYHADIVASPADPDVLWRWSMQGLGAHAQIEFDAFKVTPAPF